MAQDDKPITEQAGVIVTFYGRRGKMAEFQQKVGRVLTLDEFKVEHFFEDMSDLHNKRYLRRFDPPPAHDTTVVQLALGQPDPPHHARNIWPNMRRKLEEILDKTAKPEKKEGDAAPEEQNQEVRSPFWGYTVIYYATLVDGVSLDEQTRNKLFKLARRPNSSSSNQPPPEALAHSNILDYCDLWLMDIADEGDDSEAVTVYMALSTPNNGKKMRTKVLYGAGARLLMPDLIAHKGYHQKRQYTYNPKKQGNALRELYKERVNQLRDIIGPFLGFDMQSAPQRGNKPHDLTELEFVYAQLLYATSYLDEPRLSLAQQLKNYEWWQDKLGEGNLATFHYKQMDIAKEELDLLIDKGRGMLEGARTTIEMVQTEQNQKRERRDNLMAIVMGWLGVVITFTQILNERAVEAILNTSFGQTLLNLPWLSVSSGSPLVQLGFQILVIVLMTGLIYVWYRIRPNSN